MSAIIAKKLVKNYGPKEVVRGIGLTVREGEVVGLLGPNGAGKTTTFYMLVGVVKPTSGDVYFNKQQITRLPLHERARLGLSFLPQESSIFKKLSVRKNLEIIIEHTGLSGKDVPKGRTSFWISSAFFVLLTRRQCTFQVVNAAGLRLPGL